jgi:hypothetical protein
MQYRECSTCYITKPLTIEYFAEGKESRLGFRTQCKVCHKAYYQKWYQTKGKEVRLRRELGTSIVRGGSLYTIKEEDPEDQKQRLSRAYDQIYRNAFNANMNPEQLKRIVNDDT